MRMTRECDHPRVEPHKLSLARRPPTHANRAYAGSLCRAVLYSNFSSSSDESRRAASRRPPALRNFSRGRDEKSSNRASRLTLQSECGSNRLRFSPRRIRVHRREFSFFCVPSSGCFSLECVFKRSPFRGLELFRLLRVVEPRSSLAVEVRFLPGKYSRGCGNISAWTFSNLA